MPFFQKISDLFFPSQLTILLIEDDPLQRLFAVKALPRALRAMGIKIHLLAPDTPQELNNVTEPVDVVITDVLMPDFWQKSKEAAIRRYSDARLLEYTVNMEAPCSHPAANRVAKDATGERLVAALMDVIRSLPVAST